MSASPNLSGPYGDQLRKAIANGWSPLFGRAEVAHDLPDGILWAVASRETNLEDIVGDEGHGRGLMQIDDRSHLTWLEEHGAADGGTPDVGAAIDYAAGILRASMEYGKSRGVADDDLLKFGLSGYNAGAGRALTGYREGDSDAHTSMHNYGADVIRRWQAMFPGASAGGSGKRAALVIGAAMLIAYGMGWLG